jgi:hypothetical protein
MSTEAEGRSLSPEQGASDARVQSPWDLDEPFLSCEHGRHRLCVKCTQERPDHCCTGSTCPICHPELWTEKEQ